MERSNRIARNVLFTLLGTAFLIGFVFIGGVMHSNPHQIYRFVPSVELTDGEIPTINSEAFSTLERCEQEHALFNDAVAKDPAVLAASGQCVKDGLKIKVPTEPPPDLNPKHGSI